MYNTHSHRWNTNFLEKKSIPSDVLEFVAAEFNLKVAFVQFFIEVNKVNKSNISDCWYFSLKQNLSNILSKYMFTQKCNKLAVKISSRLENQNYKQTQVTVNTFLSQHKTLDYRYDLLLIFPSGIWWAMWP